MLGLPFTRWSLGIFCSRTVGWGQEGVLKGTRPGTAMRG